MRPRMHRPFFIPAVEYGGWDGGFRLWDPGRGKSSPYLYMSLRSAKDAVGLSNTKRSMVLVVDVEQCDRVGVPQETLADRRARAEANMLRWAARVAELDQEMAGTLGGAQPPLELAQLSPPALVRAAVAWVRSPACGDACRKARANLVGQHAESCERARAAHALKAECEAVAALAQTDIPV